MQLLYRIIDISFLGARARPSPEGQGRRARLSRAPRGSIWAYMGPYGPRRRLINTLNRLPASPPAGRTQERIVFLDSHCTCPGFLEPLHSSWILRKLQFVFVCVCEIGRAIHLEPFVLQMCLYKLKTMLKTLNPFVTR